ncbi:MAG: Arc family DNA-binding protein [Actinomycetota bacterium]
MSEPRQITLRHPAPELARRLKTLAEARGQSLNSTILQLLEEAVGVESRRERLMRWATWNEGDAAEFDAALRAQREIDVELWR